ncbi:AAA family ATPase [Falsihalocynthiibacter sp. S25ZX9]|uniref:AAA family ATPase n=1 Tax=Falsihalocynthiibacter sp. S25ZX9 TaxID=3240870 RepID=UPI0035101CA1
MTAPSTLQFISVPFGSQIPYKLKNVFVIRNDNWDDYSSRLRFDLFWFDSNGLKNPVGKLKILQSDEQKPDQTVLKTVPPERFSDDIGPNFISLGQSEHYYVQLFETFGDDARKVLSALRDISVRPGLTGRFETSSSFRNGLMRENTARRAMQFGSTWSIGEQPVEKPSFSYVCGLSDNEDSIQVDFDFWATDTLPGRIVGIIGRNAVGKTRFLAQLGADLAQVRRVSAETVEQRSARFPVNQPLFTRILTVSFSAFDRFSRPDTHEESSYVYCGIRDRNGKLTQTGLQSTFRANKKRVRELSRGNDWVEHLTKIFGETRLLSPTELRLEIEQDEEESELLGRLSSGQAILCHFVTGLLAWLQPESLVLFDEPETHLHPNAVANLIVVLTEILNDNKSYAVVATHSPIVIQEIPSKRVVVFKNEEGATFAAPLEFESFGESVAELTQHVFRTNETESRYRDALDSIAEKMSQEDALGLFPNKLGMNAKAYLLARYARKSDQ